MKQTNNPHTHKQMLYSHL